MSRTIATLLRKLALLYAAMSPKHRISVHGNRVQECPLNCSGLGTCNLDTGRCDCPFGARGAGCEGTALDSCKWAKGTAMTAHHVMDITQDMPGPWYLQGRNLTFDEKARETGVLWQGPRTCECLSDVFKFLGLEGEAAPMICFDTDTDGLRELLKSGNAAGMPPVKLIYTTRPHIWDDAPDHIVNIFVPPGSIRPLQQCSDQCQWKGWCSDYFPYQRQHWDGSARCQCYAELADDSSRGNCRSRSRSNSFVKCPSSCHGRGECSFGFCRCDQGYYGIDCGLRINHETSEPEVWVKNVSAPTMAFKPHPTFYLVDLPVHYRTKLWSNELLADALTTSPYRVARMEDAQYFWFLHTMYPSEPLMLSMFHWWRDEHPYWNRSIAEERPCTIVSQMWDGGAISSWFRGFASDPSQYRPPEIAANSPSRAWMGLYVNTALDGSAVGDDHFCKSCFQPGIDVLVPPHEPMVDAPGISYKRRKMHSLSPWSPRALRPLPERNITLFFAGAMTQQSAMPYNGRGHLYSEHYHEHRDGWVLLNSHGLQFEEASENAEWLSIEQGMSRSKFCFVPYGTMGGYGGRYVPAVLFGCVPVFWQLDADRRPTMKPFQELPDVNWDHCSLNVTAADIHLLHKTLEAVTATQLAGLQKCLEGLWPRMLFTTMRGSYMGEDGTRDAWNGAFELLARRWQQHVTRMAA